MSEAEERAAAVLSSLVRRAAFDAPAVRELAALGEAAIPALEAAIGADDSNARRLAVRALAALGVREGIATLLNVAGEEADRDAELVALALRGAIKALEPKHAERVTPFFVSLTSHDDPFVRAAAVDGLAAVRAPVARVFLRLRSDPDEFVADRAAAALGGDASEIVPDAADAAALLAEDLPLLTGLASPKQSDRLSAVRTIVKASDGAAIINRLLPNEGHGVIRRALLEAASHLRSSELYATLRGIIEDPGARDGERALAFRALVVPDDVADAELVAMVDRFGRTQDSLERASSADFGMRSGRPDVIEAAAKRLGDREPHVRESTARAFRESAAPAAIPRVVQRLREIGSSAHATKALEEEWATLVEGLLLVRRGGGYVGPEAADAMLLTMRGGPPSLRGLAADALLRVESAASLPGRTLAEAAEFLFSDGRFPAALGLLEHEHADVDYSVPALVKALYRADASETQRIATILGRSTLPAATGALSRLDIAPAVPELESDSEASGESASGSEPAEADTPERGEGERRPQATRPAPRADGDRAADGTRPRPRNVPENAPVLLQEPPSTFLPSGVPDAPQNDDREEPV